jgi:hypothetical protein
MVFCLGAATEEPQGDRSGANELAVELLKRADEVRFPKTSFEVTVAIQTQNGGQSTESRRYKVLSKGNESTLVMIVEPASERGQIMLMKGRELWLFVPNVCSPSGFPLRSG